MPDSGMAGIDNEKRFKPVDPLLSPRFTQVATFARLPLSKDLNDVDVAIVGIPFDDGTTFRSGARMGPSFIRENSRLLRSYNMFQDVSPFDELDVCDFGDIDIVPGYIDDTFEKVQNVIGELTRNGVEPLIMGGDHSITLPVLRAIHKHSGPVNLIHFDSHFDFWDQYWGKKYTHGTWLRRAIDEKLVEKVVQFGIRGPQYCKDDMKYPLENGIDTVYINAYHDDGWQNAMAKATKNLKRDDDLYISFDIDVVDPAFAPATGTPEIGGLTSWHAAECIRFLKKYHVVGFDVVEVSPPYDGPGNITSLLAANLLYEALCVMARNQKM